VTKREAKQGEMKRGNITVLKENAARGSAAMRPISQNPCNNPGLHKNYEIEKKGLAEILHSACLFSICSPWKGLCGVPRSGEGRKWDGVQVPSHTTRVLVAQGLLLSSVISIP